MGNVKNGICDKLEMWEMRSAKSEMTNAKSEIRNGMCGMRIAK